jgi:hypothetical protein
MKTISISEFETLVARNDWQREQDHEVVECPTRQVEEWDEENESLDLIDIPHVWGWASKTSILDGIKITYTEGFNYDKCDPDSLSTGTEGQDDVWSVEGVVVVDEYGDELNARELADYLGSDFSSIDYMLEIEQVTDIDVDEDSDMETFTLEIDNAPSVRFTGELVASAASSDNQAMGSRYSGQTGRWTELALYKTIGGKFICHQIGHTRWVGERTRYSGKVCESLDEVKQFFGHRWLAKELYYDAKIDDVVNVD